MLMLAVDMQMTCIHTKRDATVGLGFESDEAKQKREDAKNAPPPVAAGGTGPAKPVAKADEKSKVEEVLDPMCEFGFQGLISQVGEDYENTGNGYIEVVRNGTQIESLHHLPASLVYVFNETDKINHHFEVSDLKGVMKYAKFGDLEGFKSRNTDVTQEVITELIHFRQPTSFNPSYGIPSWLACVPWLELAQMVQGYHFDFFQNRAVPDLLVIFEGGKIQPEDMTAIQNQLRETVGAGKRHRSLVINPAQPDITCKVERLAQESNTSFDTLWSTIQLKLVSSHRIPPLLAGVTLPGKMAAANELPNALVAFQSLYVQPHQRVFELQLRKTLGAELGLEKEFNCKKITDYYDMGQMDTMSRMKQPAAAAQAQGRSLADGLKD